MSNEKPRPVDPGNVDDVSQNALAKSNENRVADSANQASEPSTTEKIGRSDKEESEETPGPSHSEKADSVDRSFQAKYVEERVGGSLNVASGPKNTREISQGDDDETEDELWDRIYKFYGSLPEFDDPSNFDDPTSGEQREHAHSTRVLQEGLREWDSGLAYPTGYTYPDWDSEATSRSWYDEAGLDPDQMREAKEEQEGASERGGEKGDGRRSC